MTNAAPIEFKGNDHLQRVILKDTKTGALRNLETAGVFVFIGLSPNVAMVKDLVEMDKLGFITTDAALQTNVPGIFAAGDVRAGSTKQAASAAGEGAAAALAIRRYVEPLASGMPNAEGRVPVEA